MEKKRKENSEYAFAEISDKRFRRRTKMKKEGLNFLASFSMAVVPFEPSRSSGAVTEQ